VIARRGLTTRLVDQLLAASDEHTPGEGTMVADAAALATRAPQLHARLLEVRVALCQTLAQVSAMRALEASHGLLAGGWNAGRPYSTRLMEASSGARRALLGHEG